MTQQAQHDQKHPFDMEKSEFEKMLERDWAPKVIDEAREESAAAAHLDAWRKSLWEARCIGRVKEAIRPWMYIIMELQGSQLGFLTDNKTYDEETVLNCATFATLRGARVTNQEFMIISGRAMLVKNFWLRMVEELHIENFVFADGTPNIQGQSGIIPCKAEGIYKGNKIENFTWDVPVRINAGQGVDAARGKAKAKFFHYLYESLTGANLQDYDADEGDDRPIFSNSRMRDVKAGIQAQQQKPIAPPPPAPPGASAPPTPTPPSSPPSPPANGHGPFQQRRPGPAHPPPAQQEAAQPEPEPEAAPGEPSHEQLIQLLKGKMITHPRLFGELKEKYKVTKMVIEKIAPDILMNIWTELNEAIQAEQAVGAAR